MTNLTDEQVASALSHNALSRKTRAKSSCDFAHGRSAARAARRCVPLRSGRIAARRCTARAAAAAAAAKVSPARIRHTHPRTRARALASPTASPWPRSRSSRRAAHGRPAGVAPLRALDLAARRRAAPVARARSYFRARASDSERGQSRSTCAAAQQLPRGPAARVFVYPRIRPSRVGPAQLAAVHPQLQRFGWTDAAVCGGPDTSRQHRFRPRANDDEGGGGMGGEPSRLRRSQPLTHRAPRAQPAAARALSPAQVLRAGRAADASHSQSEALNTFSSSSSSCTRTAARPPTAHLSSLGLGLHLGALEPANDWSALASAGRPSPGLEESSLPRPSNPSLLNLWHPPSPPPLDDPRPPTFALASQSHCTKLAPTRCQTQARLGSRPRRAARSPPSSDESRQRLPGVGLFSMQRSRRAQPRPLEPCRREPGWLMTGADCFADANDDACSSSSSSSRRGHHLPSQDPNPKPVQDPTMQMSNAVNNLLRRTQADLLPR